MTTKAFVNGSASGWPRSQSITSYRGGVLFPLPMNMGWAVDILRRAALVCKEREIRRSKLYEALDFLEGLLDPNWLVRRYRQELRWDRRNEREKEELREILRITTRGIQRACAEYLLRQLNNLGKNYRDNFDEIQLLRRQLEIVRRLFS